MATTTNEPDTTETTLTGSDFINLANYAYTSGKDPLPSQLTDYAPLTYGNGNDVKRLDAADGFYGQAFESTNAADPNVIISFEGTNLHSPPGFKFLKAQIADDKDIYQGKNPQSYYTALNFTLQAMRTAEAQGVSANNIYVDGHSLGGAEAEYVATQLDLPGITYGAPGIPKSDTIYTPSGLTDYIDYGDPVGNYVTGSPLGSFVRSNSLTHEGTPTSTGDPSNVSALTKISNDWSGNVVGKAASVVAFAEAFNDHHLLKYYAKDLGYNPLFTTDGSIGSAVGFLDAIKSELPGALGATEVSDAVVCFASGTRIETTRGRVAVEMLSTDDRVVTASGERRKIRWLGHRSIDCRRHPRPQDVWPVRIAAHAFGPNTPARDLFVSPGHAICVDDVGGEILVPAYALVNGTSVEQIEVASVTYWHVELESHDVLLAENLPAESYLDMGNRDFFVEAEAPALHGVPDAPRRSHADFCRPFVADGPSVEAVRERLRRLAPRVMRAA